ncbi:hypothetical protein KUTeg_022693 [Tegillarca granosa]|uniref:AMP-dependent synthetase/ligase domain-containing protein n=1 Tax=Tegillarca granosa TaxID=220873 RepID=A0ABQ9E5Q4_TEGGR|nr:hypothetical protein KUTeg_022693 [Tegillarca granosa]
MKTACRYATITDHLINDLENTKDRIVAVQREPDDVRRFLTKGKLVDNAELLSKYLIQSGIKKGDKVCILGPNTLEWIIGEVAILLSGAVSVHLTINTKDMEKNWKLINSVNCKALLLDPGMKNEQEHVIAALLEKKKFSDSGIPEDSTLPFIVLLRKMTEYPHFPSLQQTSKLVNSSVVTLPKIYPEETALIVPTSGSTGEPKLIKLSHFSITNSFGTFYEQELTAVNFNDRPFSWIGGYPIPQICIGGTVVFTDSSLALKSKSTDFILTVLKEEKCLSAMLLPYFLTDILENMDGYIDNNWRIKTILTGGQIVESKYANVIGKFCDNLISGYGSSEAMGIALVEPISDPSMVETGNVGHPFPGVEIKIVDNNGLVVEKGKVGNILCRSRSMFQGYYNRDDLTSEVLNPDGWLDTGDVGLISSKDEVVIKGRVKDLISRGTRKIVPSDIENVIRKMASLKEVFVVAVPDPRLLEEICVCFTPHNNTAVSESDVEEFCKTRFVTSDAYDGLDVMQRLSYIHTPMKTPYRHVTITDELINNLEHTKDHVVAVHREPDDARRVLTKGQLAIRFVYWDPNTLEWIIGEFAIVLSGAVSVHLTINTTDMEKNWKLINSVNCKALLLDPGGQIVESKHANVIGKFCDNLVLVYGSSEALFLNLNEPISDPSSVETGNVGHPFTGVEIKIVDDNGLVVEKGKVGKILCRSRFMFQGYYNRDDLTSEVLNPDGWLDTGDVGLINSKDEVVIKGRVKNLISRGTRKIVPSDIENVIRNMASLKEVVVVAVPDTRLLEEICVCFTSHDETTVLESDVEEFCKTRFVARDAYDGLDKHKQDYVNVQHFV